ncbi:hypothetical protein EVAR_85082_1 [Eumeta japonica]|uniref:Uncharacterized protein n=1 Tax=Eumeta variegata TaxID=151549 RepID=A0A4C1XAG6_EUMVA|nr:hypothetical protein EVAR_85082_1 [Eumeta japonica]
MQVFYKISSRRLQNAAGHYGVSTAFSVDTNASRAALNGRMRLVSVDKCGVSIKLLILVGVSKLKTGRGTESRASTGAEIENKTGVKIECRDGIRIESLIGIETQKIKELFVLGFV